MSYDYVRSTYFASRYRARLIMKAWLTVEDFRLKRPKVSAPSGSSVLSGPLGMFLEKGVVRKGDYSVGTKYIQEKAYN